MAEGAYGGGRGILRRRTALERFTIERRAPSSDLAAIVDYLWILHWNLRDREPHRQQVLTRPAVNMTFTTGGRARIAGVVRDVFTETIAGRRTGLRRPVPLHPRLHPHAGRLPRPVRSELLTAAVAYRRGGLTYHEYRPNPAGGSSR
jgi:hypothetical protein